MTHFVHSNSCVVHNIKASLSNQRTDSLGWRKLRSLSLFLRVICQNLDEKKQKVKMKRKRWMEMKLCELQLLLRTSHEAPSKEREVDIYKVWHTAGLANDEASSLSSSLTFHKKDRPLSGALMSRVMTLAQLGPHLIWGDN